jgi:hypothetical protein
MKENQLLVKFATKFFGYGNLKAPYWFVGYEEGFPKKRRRQKLPEEAMLRQVIIRAKVWSKLKEKDVLDLQKYHNQVAACLQNENTNQWFEDFNKWFRESTPPLQPTWRVLIYLLLRLEKDKELKDAAQNHNETARTNRLREYQRECWGCRSGKVCLLEMYGLPKPNQNVWIYGNSFSTKPAKPRLSDRDLREEACESFRPVRHAWFTKQLKKYKPKLVIFYNNDPLSVCHWSKVCNISKWHFQTVKPTGSKCFRYAQNGKMLFICIPHPSSHGIENNYWAALADEIGNLIRATAVK